MNNWNTFINAAKTYYSQFDETSFLSSEEGYVFKNPKINLNMAILSGNDVNKQIKFIDTKCSASSIIFNLDKDIDSVINSNEGVFLAPIKVFPIISGKFNDSSYSIQYYDNITIKRIEKNQINVKDFIQLFYEMKKIPIENNIFNENIFSSNIFSYIGYYGSTPACILCAIKFEQSIFISSAYLSPRFKNTKILSLIGKQLLYDAGKNDINNFLLIDVDDYANKLFSFHPIKLESWCNLWVKL